MTAFVRALGLRVGFRRCFSSGLSVVKSLTARAVSLVVRLAALICSSFGELRIIILWGDRFGPLCSESAKYLRLRQTPEGHRLILVGVIGPVCNEPFLTMLRRGMPVVRSRLLHGLLQLAVRYGLARDILKIQEHESYLRIINQVPRSPISLTSEDSRRGAEMLAKLGVPAGSWFVCFHARDASYLSRVVPGTDWRYHGYRDCSIENYLPSMRLISDLGGYAIRMGQVVEQPLPSTGDPRIVDYATWAYDPFLDLYLLSHCRFMVCCTAGIHSAVEFFDRPIAMANTIPLSYVPAQAYSRFIPKLLKDRKSGRILSFDEMAEIGIMDRSSLATLSSFYRERNLEVLENSPEDILALTNEMLRIEQPVMRSAEQEAFDRYFTWLERGETCASIASSFLKRHPQLLGSTLKAGSCSPQLGSSLDLVQSCHAPSSSSGRATPTS